MTDRYDDIAAAMDRILREFVDIQETDAAKLGRAGLSIGSTKSFRTLQRLNSMRSPTRTDRPTEH
jgi:hypothetical protein